MLRCQASHSTCLRPHCCYGHVSSVTSQQHHGDARIRVLHEYVHHHGAVAMAHWTRVHNSNAVGAALAKLGMSAGY